MLGKVCEKISKAWTLIKDWNSLLRRNENNNDNKGKKKGRFSQIKAKTKKIPEKPEKFPRFFFK